MSLEGLRVYVFILNTFSAVFSLSPLYNNRDTVDSIALGAMKRRAWKQTENLSRHSVFLSDAEFGSRKMAEESIIYFQGALLYAESKPNLTN